MRNEMVQLITAIGRTLVQSGSTQPLLQRAADEIVAHLDAQFVRIWTLDSVGDTLELQATAGEATPPKDSQDRVAVGAPGIGTIASDMRAHVANTLTNDPHLGDRSWLMREGIVAFGGYPLIVDRRLLGVLTTHWAYPLTDEMRDALIAVANQIALVIDYHRTQAELESARADVLAAETSKAHFLANMSHELRTPLNSIIGFADVLLMGLDGNLTERMLEDVQLIRNNGYHLRDIINDILDMAKIEANRLEIIFEPFDIQRVAGEVMAMAAPLAEQKGLQLHLDIPDDIDPLVADRTRVRQVLWNLIGNAIKFTDRGDIAMRVQRQNGEVLFTVTDTGIGIAEEHLPHIFDQFSQINPGRRGSISGTGLGLSISKRLVELHGGRIWVESLPDQGSTFRFAIPVREADPAAAPEAAL